MSDSKKESIRSLIVACLGGGQASVAAIEALAVRRRDLATALLSAGDDAAAVAACLPDAEDLGVSGLPYQARAGDEGLLARIGEQLAGERPPANAVMAAMTLAPAHHFPAPRDLKILPESLQLPYARYITASPAMFERAGEADQFGRHRLQAMERLHAAVFRDRLPLAGKIAEIGAGASNLMLYFNGLNLRPYFRRRAELLEWHLGELHFSLHHLPPLAAHARTRVGILHGGLEPGTETYYLLGHLAARLPGLEVILYLERDPAGPLAPEFARRVDRISALPNDLAAAAAQIRADELDVLLISRNITAVESAAAKLAAHRLARVQVIGTASPVTSGLSSADFFMSGEMNDPDADAQDHYEENLARLPGLVTAYAYGFDRDPPTRSFSRADFGISGAEVIFFSAANCFKIIPEVLITWMRILAAAPGSRLVLIPYNPNWFDSYATSLFQRRIARQCAECGVAADRITVLDAVPSRADLHAVLAIADIYLDSFPFAGACSLVDPLQVGLPIVAMDGGAFRSSVAAAILKATGLDHMVCADVESYVARACALAGDTALRRRERDEVKRLDPSLLPCTWTAPLAQAFGEFVQAAAAAWSERADMLRILPPRDLLDRIRDLAGELRRSRNAGYRRLTDLALITQCLYPYLQTLKAEGVPAGRIVDVGACLGEASMPYLRGGWRVDMFEPDPECRQPLAGLCVAFPQAKHFPVAVTGAPAGPLTFHKRSLGLSGLGASPYAAGGKEVTVPSTTLSEVYGPTRLQADLLKIDAEGFDLEILAGADIKSLAPKAVMIEFGTAFARQTPAAIQAAIDRMRGEGYGVAVFSNRQLEGFGVSNWSCELDSLVFGNVETSEGASGNMIFFREDDTTFLTCLLLLLESFQPARRRRWGLPAA